MIQITDLIEEVIESATRNIDKHRNRLDLDHNTRLGEYLYTIIDAIYEAGELDNIR